MRFWKRLSALLLLVAICLIGPDGCSTTGDPSAPHVQVTPERVQSVARLAAYGSAKGFLISHPEYRPELEKAKGILTTLAAAENWDISALAEAFQSAGFKELRSEEAILAVEGAVLMIDLVSGKAIDLKQVPYARAAIIGSLDGLNLALASPSTKPSADMGGLPPMGLTIAAAAPIISYPRCIECSGDFGGAVGEWVPAGSHGASIRAVYSR